MKSNYRATSFPGLVFSGEHSSNEIGVLLDSVERGRSGRRVWVVDPNIESRDFLSNQSVNENEIFFTSVVEEPSTDYVNAFTENILTKIGQVPKSIVGLGGGATLDIAKAVSICAISDSPSEDFQGWDKVELPGIPKIGIPTIAGTGSESSRTAVLTHSKSGLKLGINSDFSRFDGVILDPIWQLSVPKELFFRTIMDAYFHSHEVLTGRYRNNLSDQLAEIASQNIEQMFSQEFAVNSYTAMKALNASFMAGLALTSSYVGLIHPLSAAIGVEYKLPHSLSNLIALRGLQSFYPTAFEMVSRWAEIADYEIPRWDEVVGVKPDAKLLFQETVKHNLPIENFLGPDWTKKLNMASFQDVIGML